MIDFCRESLGLTAAIPMELSILPGRGSDRTFFRVQWNRKASAILVRYDPKRLENACYADIAVFLREIDVPAPRLIRHDPDQKLILMEDLGDRDLWSFRGTPWENRRLLYQKTLAVAHKLHSFPEKDFPSGRVRLMEGFGPDLYRWERDYFKEHFVRNVCGVDLRPALERELEKELAALGERLSGRMRCLVHRDLQSQNVMIRDEEPFLIDFQGLRFGSPFYDLGSLLCDPYVDFSDKERGELLSFYYRLSQVDLDQARFRNYFWDASAQRLMQALGAYGFLALKKGLIAFQEHIPAGLRNLQKAAAQAPSLPHLSELSLVCQQALDRNRDPAPFPRCSKAEK
jgi:aminoglycoside/choline kinase family phosphotransferase